MNGTGMILFFFLQKIPNCPVEINAGGYYQGKDFKAVKKI